MLDVLAIVALALLVGLAAIGIYAFAIEPYRLRFPRYHIKPTGWTPGLKLKIAVLADLHTAEPWMTANRVAKIVAATNATQPDLVVLLGDYVATRHRLGYKPVPKSDWAGALSQLKAPLGVHAVLGNHDWWEDPAVQQNRNGPTPAGEALAAVGIPVYENQAVRIQKDGSVFWLAGLGDQRALRPLRTGSRRSRIGVDDLDGTLALVSDDAPVIMMAHEPDIFAKMPDRVSLTLSGHTHGGQVRLFGYAPAVPTVNGRRYLYGHFREAERHLIVSGGLGTSFLPIRFGSPPEVPIIEIG